MSGMTRNFIMEGAKTEQLFADSYGSDDVVWATPHENINDHWDVQIDGKKYDVKSVKRLNRHDPRPDHLRNWLEFKNVHGEQGWMYGKADFIAFETPDGFIIVDRLKLVDYAELIMKDEPMIYPTKVDYKFYQRYNRKDVILPIHTVDLLAICEKFIPKKG